MSLSTFINAGASLTKTDHTSAARLDLKKQRYLVSSHPFIPPQTSDFLPAPSFCFLHTFLCDGVASEIKEENLVVPSYSSATMRLDIVVSPLISKHL